MAALESLQNTIGYHFRNDALLQKALTHRSHSSAHNERLEFLGDSVLNLAVASLLYELYVDFDEGGLSRLRSNLVRQQMLHEVAQKLDLSNYLRLGEGELKSGGFRRPSILADTVEAVLGAIFLDGGFDAAHAVIRALYVPILNSVDLQTFGKDPKTLLQEYLQSRRIALPQYQVIATRGAPHNQEFEVECLIPRFDIKVSGRGSSRRAAEQIAAQAALEDVRSKHAHRHHKPPRNKRHKDPQMKLVGISTVQEIER